MVPTIESDRFDHVPNVAPWLIPIEAVPHLRGGTSFSPSPHTTTNHSEDITLSKLE